MVHLHIFPVQAVFAGSAPEVVFAEIDFGQVIVEREINTGERFLPVGREAGSMEPL